MAILRIARTSKIEVDPLLARMISDLGQLEQIFRNALKPPKVRKRKHEIDDVLILKLADTLSAYNAMIFIQNRVRCRQNTGSSGQCGHRVSLQPDDQSKRPGNSKH